MRTTNFIKQELFLQTTFFMPNSFSQLYIHHVSLVKYRRAMISEEIENHVYSYIVKIVRDHEQEVIAINGMPDHIHLLLRLRSDISPAKLIQFIKGNSSRYINDKKLTQTKFKWQPGGATFSVSSHHVDVVKKYIWRQKMHHAQTRLKQEYVTMLRQNNIEFDPSYLPDFILS